MWPWDQLLCNRQLQLSFADRFVCILQIPALLEDGRIEMRTMGAELLCTTTRVQGEGDNKLDALQDNTPLVRDTQSRNPVPASRQSTLLLC